tara:strand:- start:304 stop:663 length:360 start_codon:yes stop_codon:yes gene_type:complete
MKTIKLIAAAVVFTMVNVAAVIYLNNYLIKEDKKPLDEPTICEPAPIKEAGLHSQEAMVLAAMLDQVIKEARMRDTVVVQQLMRVQHKMEMHKQRMPLCPDCANPSPTAKHHYTKDDSR